MTETKVSHRSAVDSWRQVEHDALEQARADVEAVEAMPLEVGRDVAWVDCRFGRTDSLSVVHRAGEPIGGTPVTLCGAVIPSAMLRLTLSVNLVRTLGRCRYCETAYLTNGRGAA